MLYLPSIIINELLFFNLSNKSNNLYNNYLNKKIMYIATLAGQALAFITPHLIKAGKDLGKGLVNDAWELIKPLFESDEEKEVIQEFEDNPNDAKKLGVVEHYLEKKLNADNELVEKLTELISKLNNEKNSQSPNTQTTTQTSTEGDNTNISMNISGNTFGYGNTIGIGKIIKGDEIHNK